MLDVASASLGREAGLSSSADVATGSFHAMEVLASGEGALNYCRSKEKT